MIYSLNIFLRLFSYFCNKNMAGYLVVIRQDEVFVITSAINTFPAIFKYTFMALSRGQTPLLIIKLSSGRLAMAEN